MESIIGLYKTECLRRGPFTKGPLRSISDVEYATIAWVDRWNHHRLHTPCGLIPQQKQKPATTTTHRPHSTGTKPGTLHCLG